MSHHYTELEEAVLWKAVDAALAELELNRDVQLSTAREYVVGYLCEQLARQRITIDGLDPAPQQTAAGRRLSTSAW